MVVKKLAALISLICCFVFPVSMVEAGITERNEMAAIGGIIKNQSPIFSDEFADISYDFTKVKKIHILDANTALVNGVINIDKARVYSVNERNVIKPLKRKVVANEEADVLLEVVIEEWKSTFNHRVPERIAYEAYESYEGYKEVKKEPSFFERSEYERKKRIAKEKGHTPPPPPRTRTHKEWIISRTWFFGSKRVITPDDRDGKASKISRSTPFNGSTKVTYPAYDVYAADVVAQINLRDKKTNNIILTRKGTYTYKGRGENNQIWAYETIFKTFCEEYKDLAKQMKKKYKENKSSAK